jgi:hypothetical protein
MMRRIAAAALVLALGLLVMATSASAATTPSSSCRASALRLKVGPLDPIEPVVSGANAPSACVTHGAGQAGVNVKLPPPLDGLLSATTQNAYAITQAVKQNPATVSDLPSAAAGVTNLQLTLAGLKIEADVIDSTASATCVNGQPSFTGSSKVVALKLNGTDISLDQLIDAISQAINGSPLSGLVTLHVNQQVTTANSLVQTALHLSIAPAGANLIDLVLGESKVSTDGNVCAAGPTPPVCGSGTVLDPTTNTCIPNPSCPAGTTFDPQAHACVTNPPNCPAGTTFDPQARACVANPPNCPSGTTYDTNARACVPNASSCPSGSTFDPTNHVCVTGPKPCPAGSVFVSQYGACVVVVTKTTTQTTPAGSGNGNIGTANGPLAHCGVLKLVSFANNKKTSLSQRYKGHDRVVIRGRLVSCGSNPQSIIGAKLDVVHIMSGVRHVAKTGVKTRKQGRFTLILPRNIRTRNIEFDYRGDLNKAKIVSHQTLRYTLRNSKGRVLR